MSNKIAIIGVGGIGTVLTSKLAQYLNFREEDDYSLMLIDGDEFEIKNLERQEFNGEVGTNKATAKRLELEDKFPKVAFTDVDVYLTEENVEGILGDIDVVFVCVDNHATRRMISYYAATRKDITIISGGNELTDGNVQLYVRRDNVEVTPRITDYHDEIENPGDKNPASMSCEELAASGSPQLLFTNMTVSIIMLWVFYNLLNNKIVGSETYFDIQNMTVNTVRRQLPEREVDKKD